MREGVGVGEEVEDGAGEDGCGCVGAGADGESGVGEDLFVAWWGGEVVVFVDLNECADAIGNSS